MSSPTDQNEWEQEIKMAGPAFRPGEYKKLSKAQKIIYWTIVISVFFFIFSIWIFGPWWR
ncbi:hypothetical protein [Herbaspirillum autotrophicum]|uniref:hypothetical protein n=1 Tax=Herbaspirillum autotrophicum TaxID=180195 RepID=UPI0012ECE3BF|nr:hypothetical protein [Herbaspirillum autotrophicum]